MYHAQMKHYHSIMTKQNSKQKYYRFYLEQKWMAWKNHNDFEKSNKTRFDVQ